VCNKLTITFTTYNESVRNQIFKDFGVKYEWIKKIEDQTIGWANFEKSQIEIYIDRIVKFLGENKLEEIKIISEIINAVTIHELIHLMGHILAEDTTDKLTKILLDF